MPTAVYSRRAVSAHSRTSAGSARAPRPSGSGHREKNEVTQEVPAFCAPPWRGSVEIVTGMPCGVRSASSWRRLCQRAAAPALSSPWTLKWFMCLASTTSSVPDLEIAPGPSSSVPSGPVSITVWNISPTFSASESLPSRSSVRSSGLRRGSSKGSIRPLPFRSR